MRLSRWRLSILHSYVVDLEERGFARANACLAVSGEEWMCVKERSLCCKGWLVAEL
jgi:hypothetical protein